MQQSLTDFRGNIPYGKQSRIEKNEEKEQLRNKIFVGDNLVCLNKKREIFKNSIDFIYIDPPYNTSSRFSYEDCNDSWEKDIKARLYAAKEWMKMSSAIFISIDDNELASLAKICFEVFGKSNYVGSFITRQSQRSNAKHINIVHEYVVCFAKDKKKLPPFRIRRMDIPEDRDMIVDMQRQVRNSLIPEDTLKTLIKKYTAERGITWLKNYCNVDKDGRIFFAKDLSVPGKPSSLEIPEIGLSLPPLKSRKWSSSQKFIQLYKAGRLHFKNWRPYEIEYLDETEDNIPSILPFYSRNGTEDLKKLGLYRFFDTPKPVELIKFLIRASLHSDSLILDFYAGSGTTAQAVYEINKEDGRHHSYIMIQSPEKINKATYVYENMTACGYINPSVSDITELRIKTFLEKEKIQPDYVIEHI